MDTYLTGIGIISAALLGSADVGHAPFRLHEARPEVKNAYCKREKQSERRGYMKHPTTVSTRPTTARSRGHCTYFSRNRTDRDGGHASSTAASYWPEICASAACTHVYALEGGVCAISAKCCSAENDCCRSPRGADKPESVATWPANQLCTVASSPPQKCHRESKRSNAREIWKIYSSISHTNHRSSSSALFVSFSVG